MLKNFGITLPEGLVYLGHAAFAECESNGNLIIPSTVSFIGHSCFKVLDLMVT